MLSHLLIISLCWVLLWYRKSKWQYFPQIQIRECRRHLKVIHWMFFPTEQSTWRCLTEGACSALATVHRSDGRSLEDDSDYTPLLSTREPWYFWLPLESTLCRRWILLNPEYEFTIRRSIWMCFNDSSKKKDVEAEYNKDILYKQTGKKHNRSWSSHSPSRKCEGVRATVIS